MKIFYAEVDVMLHRELLDPQGKAVTASLKTLNLGQIDQVRIGKHISFEVSAADKQSAEHVVVEACKLLLANPVMEKYTFNIFEK